ncbi:hypothetical protein SmJEL517_g06121 [Synchytrium microbalum]|uniref:Acyl-protein thioesterase 1 n=1 Tax=Synchytrium microbalum TaxID=1806994 RepID=A0A507BYE4_9FUNG|nr:uncharacterized protein SmJEL517_g06121 [Synchytrium microbalum]TPX30293.1 hypothetical protein SmJEL517_g06121 [Synchytrium microbalum]
MTTIQDMPYTTSTMHPTIIRKQTSLNNLLEAAIQELFYKPHHVFKQSLPSPVSSKIALNGITKKSNGTSRKRVSFSDSVSIISFTGHNSHHVASVSPFSACGTPDIPESGLFSEIITTDCAYTTYYRIPEGIKADQLVITLVQTRNEITINGPDSIDVTTILPHDADLKTVKVDVYQGNTLAVTSTSENVNTQYVVAYSGLGNQRLITHCMEAAIFYTLVIAVSVALIAWQYNNHATTTTDRKIQATVKEPSIGKESVSTVNKPKQPNMTIAGITIPAKGKHLATLIFLHGLGDSGQGWAPVGRMIQPQLPHVKMIFPDAPTRPVTVNNGYRMPAWFDVYQLGAAARGNTRVDTEGMNETLKSINSWISDEIEAGIPASRIVIGGFSQGSAMALLHAVTSERKLAGYISLSGWLSRPEAIEQSPGANKETPIFMGHGDSDEVVLHHLGVKSYDALKTAGWNVSWKTYEDMGHSAREDEFEDITKFLLKNLHAE